MRDHIPEAGCCPICNSTKLVETAEVESFPFGDEREIISVHVPVITCADCGFRFTDQRAEVARREAVYRHRNLLTPSEIKSIRENVHGLSRRAFDEAFGLSQASMERWENGKLIQSEAADTLLRALEDRVTAARVDRRKRMSGPNVIWDRFPHIEPAHQNELLDRKAAFHLGRRG